MFLKKMWNFGIIDIDIDAKEYNLNDLGT